MKSFKKQTQFLADRLWRAFAFYLLISLLAPALVAQDPRPVYQGQGPVRAVDTTSRPIVKQERRTFAFEEDGVYFANDFDGARLNAIERTGENSYTITITPENEPINMSPWYAFRVWSKKKKDVSVKLVYPEFARHRYSPLLSRDGRRWKPVEAVRITEEEKGPEAFGPGSRPKRITMRLKVSRRPQFISAQELQSSRHVFEWIDRLARRHKLPVEEIGKSTEGRPLRMFTLGNRNAKNKMMVISRQHPPEVTGYFAMQAFVEEIANGSKLSKEFRKNWAVYVVPLMNPDGVDAGHWRHNAGGIDLNRDWTNFNQPEGRAVSELIKRREAETGGKFYFGIDFHSTWDDIYYPMDRKFESLLPGLIYDWIDNLQKRLPGYKPNVDPAERDLPAIVSRNYFFVSHQMEAIVFEIGDNTPRDFIKKKGQTGAVELMKLLMERKKES